MQTQEISYDRDGVTYVGHLAVPAGDDVRPGVLVCHEGPGLDAHAKRRAEQLAGLGYVAFALDYYGGGVPVPREEMMNRLGPMLADSSLARAHARHGLEVLLAQPRVDRARVAAIGYCFGGTMALELARDGAELQAVVGFHSGLATGRPEDAAQIVGAVLVCIGAEDPIIPPEQRAAFEAEMRAGNVDWRMNLYGGAAHSFTNDLADLAKMPGVAYHRPTDDRSWRAMLDLFAEVLD